MVRGPEVSRRRRWFPFLAKTRHDTHPEMSLHGAQARPENRSAEGRVAKLTPQIWYGSQAAAPGDSAAVCSSHGHMWVPSQWNPTWHGLHSGPMRNDPAPHPSSVAAASEPLHTMISDRASHSEQSNVGDPHGPVTRSWRQRPLDSWIILAAAVHSSCALIVGSYKLVMIACRDPTLIRLRAFQRVGTDHELDGMASLRRERMSLQADAGKHMQSEVVSWQGPAEAP